MHVLIKFTSKKFAESFQSGNLYMNSLNYFWNNGFDGQKDILEGVISSTNPQNITELPSDFKDIIQSDVLYQAVGFSFCHVFCMACIDLIPLMHISSGLIIDMHTPSNMQEFGEYAVIIDDETEFLKRINRAFKNQKYLCGRVNYHSPTLNNQKIDIGHHLILKREDAINIPNISGKVHQYDAFDKFDKYKSQNEWRICLYDGKPTEEAIQPEIGDIHDISHIVKASDIETEIYKLKYNKNLYSTSEEYYGNINRKELRKLFYELGNNQAWQIFTIG